MNRGESNWDRYLHLFPDTIDGNGDVACDSYHLWRRDVQMCEEVGLDMYRFSIAWSRLLPTGLPNYISEDGKNYYNNLIDGTFDFYALNHYSSLLVRKAKPGEAIGKTLVDGIEELGIVLEADPSWEKGDIKWLTVHPEGLRQQLNYLKNTYNLSEIMITENGFFSSNASLNDVRTVNYTRKYLEQVALAIQDGVNVTAYFHWSLMDNFDKGYDAKFGLYAVDFTDTNRTRTPRLSSRYYSKVIKTHCTDPEDY
ncbi:unnamed protein product [Spodoptera littoralis]|uniref:Beta-glucosidase n=1 Tax=Spodoptera littoralis TaxID=7109 RepID=A0A9P0N5P1_SPOLI|nr:unnamed protein product [Spodoptera littoralis]CAH1640815.1 unnamed protein product [Spodoptera littoralis]